MPGIPVNYTARNCSSLNGTLSGLCEVRIFAHFSFSQLCCDPGMSLFCKRVQYTSHFPNFAVTQV